MNVGAFARHVGANVPKGIERIRIKDMPQWHALRSRDVTASDIAALGGVHDYTTEYKLFNLKTGKLSPQADNEALDRGKLLEPVAVELLRRERPDWTILYPVGFYYRDPKWNIGATPDVLAIDPARPGFGSVQIKSVHPRIKKEKWDGADEESVEPPLWIAIQSVTEADLTGASWCAAAPLVVDYGLDIEIIEIELNRRLLTGLREASRRFWKRVADNDPPAPVFERDAETIRALYGDSDEGKLVDLSENNRISDLLVTRAELQARESDGRAATKHRRVIDAEIFYALQDAAYGTLRDGTRIAAKQHRRGGGKSYRTVQIQGVSKAKPAATAFPERF